MRGQLRVLLAASLLVVGCGASLQEQGHRLLSQEEYAAAVEALQAALAGDPTNARILLDLAEALYRQDELERAAVVAKRALIHDSESGDAVLLLGLIHEKRGDRRAAMEAYRSYTGMSRLSSNRRLIEARIDQLLREQIAEDTKQALAREATLEVTDIPENSIAVAPFRNMGADRALDPLEKGLAEMMITDLSKVKALQVVERIRMQEMMKEIGLGMTGAVDPSSAPRLGKLIGAGKVVNGSFADLAQEQLRLDVTVSGVESGEIDASETRGPLARLFRLQKELTLSIIEEMGIRLTDEEREAIQFIPTENLLAFMAYSRGLDLEDQGKVEEAEAEFQKAAQLDPKFGAAQTRMERARAGRIGAGSRRAMERTVLARRPKPPAVALQGTKKALARRFGEGVAPYMDVPRAKGTLARLTATGRNAGAGFIPTWKGAGADLRKPIPDLLKQLETITFRMDEAVIDIIVPLDTEGP